jgi:hypothetical protein
MLIKSIYDVIGAFVIGGGNHLFTTIGTVEDQHVNQSPLHLLQLVEAAKALL